MHCCSNAQDLPAVVDIVPGDPMHYEVDIDNPRHDKVTVSMLQAQLNTSCQEQRELKTALATLQSELKAQKKVLDMLTEKVGNATWISEDEAQRKIPAEDADIGREQKESQEVLPKDETETLMQQYALEENLYGYVIAAPSRWIFHILILFIYYALVIGVSAVITLGVADAWSSSQDDLNDTCKRDGEMWDCRPPGFTTLQNFAALDMNGDGIWSVVEARKAGLLGNFRGLHEMALGTPKFHNMIMPFKQAEINLFCYLFWVSPNSLVFLNESESIAMAEASGYLTDAIRSSCSDAQDDWNLWSCYMVKICPGFDPPSRGFWYLEDSTFEAAPARSSTDQYMEATTHLTEISHSLHSSLLSNLLRPCRIVHPHLCSNVEVGGMLRGIPMWEGLNPEDRVKECEVYVRDSCPQLFGTEYNRFQLGFSITCGEVSYSPGELDASPALKSFIRMSNPICDDNDTLALMTANRIAGANPIMHFLLTAVERKNGLPKDYLTVNLTCDMGAQLGYCSGGAAEVVNPDDNRSYILVATIFGQACPATCCQLNSYGCPSPCMAAKVKTEVSFGSVTCVGPACSDIEIIGESSALTLLRKGGYKARENARLVIQSDLSLQMYIRSMRVGDELDKFCLGGRVEVDKVYYCSGNAPERVQLPRRVGGQVEIEWMSENACGYPYCGWHVLIVEAGEPESYTVSLVSYENVDKFHDDRTGIATWIYKLFFTLVLFIWIGYIMMECKEAWSFLDCVCNHPDLAWQSQFVVLVGVCLPRMAIAFWVFFVGVVLLITSTSYIDIVLNGVALAFILDIDEYLFVIAVSAEDRQKVMDADIFKWRRNPRVVAICRKYKALHVYACLVVALTVTLIQYSWKFGYDLESVGFRCACALSGANCVDAVLGV